MIQMNLDPINPIIKKELVNTISNYLIGRFMCHDYDNVKYCIELSDKENCIYFSFGAPNYNDVFKIGGDLFIQKYYQSYEVQKQPYKGFDITFQATLNNLKQNNTDSVSVYFALSFTDIVDRTIAQLMLDEFVESNRHVKNPPSVQRVEKILDQSQRSTQSEVSVSKLRGNTSGIQSYTYPQILVDKFPELKNLKEEYLNGLISFKNIHIEK
ncbi:hypothetical protein IMG5_152490 [Ichthyophthirius multifiliis]|uniref:Uncharacterized protein n=1 Tax=Ichthyophthirius multifiliis TaxID=5932 RepID=G0QYV4_ICHMU|nr:hypothetical protein IMG5_152490 [Ichthyophthirius multifiliis]EGR29600.1 hypothetical protein IMG5_152490 [Ichthyophthirius multifiliis]|eukprot:XP_004030836.1 hypothetical protein IMG5_152490 [Ichthyophthirius multifiliis]